MENERWTIRRDKGPGWDRFVDHLIDVITDIDGSARSYLVPYLSALANPLTSDEIHAPAWLAGDIQTAIAGLGPQDHPYLVFLPPDHRLLRHHRTP